MRSERVRRTQPLSSLVLEALSVGVSLSFVDAYAHSFGLFWRGLLPGQWAQVPLALSFYLSWAVGMSLGLHALLNHVLRGLRPYATTITCALGLLGQLLLSQEPLGLLPAGALAWLAALLPPLVPLLFPLRALQLGHRGQIGLYGFAVGGAALLWFPRATALMEVAPLARAVAASAVAVMLLVGWTLTLVPMARPLRTAAWLLWSALPAAGCLWLWPTQAHTQAGRPNLLVVSADTMRASSLSLYGGLADTPALSRLAERGMLAERYYSTAPWTVPSLESLWSSRFPPGVSAQAPAAQRALELTRYSNLGAYFLPEPALPRRLSELGYQTAAFITNPAMAFQDWLLAEFERHHVTGVMFHSRVHGWVDSFPLLQKALSGIGAPTTERPIDMTWLAQRYARDFLRNADERPFLLWTHLIDPHTPYDPPARHRRGPQVFDFLKHDEHPWKVRAEADAVRALYRGEISYVDEALGAILSELEALGLSERTFVLFTVDHGEEIVERGGFGHGHTLFEEQIHVPFVLAGPGLNAGRLRVPLSAIDVVPTLAGLLGVPSSPAWRGRDLSRFLRGEADAPAAAPVFAQATGLLPASPEPLQAVVDGDLKLIRGIDTQVVRLFDLAQDRWERQDVSAQRPDDVVRLRRHLDAFTASFPATFSQFELPPPNEIQKASMDGLRALGYAH